MNLKNLTSRWLLAAASILSLLSACGGGDGLGSGGTGAAHDSFATGTVDGFGSVYIAGERCDHVGARIGWDTVAGGPEQPASPELKLGQRVEVDLDADSAACRILAARIAPELIGIVETTSPLVVAGAQVLVNDDPAVGPVTVFEGYAGAADIAAGDRVEVHGKAVAVSGGVAIRATRIERKPATETWVRVAGVVSNLDAGAGRFSLGGLTVHYGAGTTVWPTGFVLRDGLTIAMWSTGAVDANREVQARFIRVLHRQFADQQKLRVQGPVSGCNGANPCTQPVIDGIQIEINDATVFTAGSRSEVADGRTLHVRGSFDAASGKLVARAVAVRRQADGLVTLTGSVSDFASDGSSTFFRVRGVPVTTDANTSFEAGCTVTDDRIVAVAGHIAGASVLATRIACPSLAVGTVVDAYGQVSDFDGAARSFRITGRALFGLATLTWDDNTVFSNGATPQTLANGNHVAVRGVYQGNGRFLLLRVVLDDTPPASPTGGMVFSALGIAHHVSAGSMWVNLVPMAVTPASDVRAGVVNGALVRAWFYRDAPNARWVVLYAHPVSW
ncbi:MAG: DUF5666 domain-containing protein [Pseudomonadota bacterium]